MALNAEQKALMEERRKLDAQIKPLKAKAAELRAKYDALTQRLNLEHKVGKMTPAEREALKDLIISHEK